jgi:hypothetical protein
MPSDTVRFYGHPQIKATHTKTFEITRAESLTPRGDCIVGVRADKGCRDLAKDVKRALQQEDARVRLLIEVNDHHFQVRAYGHPRLALTHPHDLVVRRSRFTCTRTLAVGADAAASNLPREMVAALRDPATRGFLVIEVEL